MLFIYFLSITQFLYILRREKVKWKYAINLCGQDFPIKTNFEIVETLQALSGYNSLETIAMPDHKTKR